jgi:tRNA/tmRNA/rRNA uracil-C5-methylase (TrmA/RlmC/RlmD family)
VVAVEEGGEAFRDLRRNVAANRAANVKAVRGPIERFRPSGRFDAVIVDPPRTGLSERAVRLLGGLRAARLLYVSCDPATLARDVARLSGAYRIGGIEAYDFFPQTHHVETLAVLERLQ